MEQKIGTVIHLYNKINVAIIDLKKPLQIGDVLHFVGPHTDCEQKTESLQIEHEAVQKAPKGKQVGLKLGKKAQVKEGDEVFIKKE